MGTPGSPRPPLGFFSSSEVGRDAERGLRRGPCQLLPPRQRAGDGLVPASPSLCVPIPWDSRFRVPPDPQVQVGVELEANTRLQETTFAFGYQLNLPQANVVFRGEPRAAPAPAAPAPSRCSPCAPNATTGLVDSNWSVGGVLEKKLPPLPVTLALGAFLNHWKNRFHCGFSVIVG